MAAIGFIEVRGVTAAYGGRPALRGVSARFDAGTITCIEGPNGAGKSTLLGVIGSLQKPRSGEVFYGPLGVSAESARREIGWLSHDGRMYRDLSGRENIELMARLHGMDGSARTSEICDLLAVNSFVDQPLGTLSRGQRQRVALARALVHDPSILLLDEPLTGLDSESAARLEAVLMDERRRSRIIVVVNHLPGFAERVEARRLLVDRGRVVQSAKRRDSGVSVREPVE